MRIPEFRVWLPHAGMLYDPYIGRAKANRIFNDYWMQYTGVDDKSCKKIFRGDIVKCTAHWSSTEPESFVAEVIFNQGMFGVIWQERSDNEMLKLTCFEIEVLGNIWENPELLKEINGT